MASTDASIAGEGLGEERRDGGFADVTIVWAFVNA